MGYWIGAVGAATVVVASLVWHYVHRWNSKGFVETKVTFNIPEIAVETAAISPDGKYLAFSDPQGLWIQAISKHGSHRLAAPANSAITQIAWLPDSTSLLLSATAKTEKISRLWVLSIFGGAPQRLRDDAAGGVPSPNGMKIAYVRGGGKEAWTVSDNGEDPQRIVVGDGDVDLSGFVWSSDGSSVVYKVSPSYSHRARLRWQNLATGKTTDVLSERALGELCGTSDGLLVYSLFESPANLPHMNLWKMRINMRTAQILEAPRKITEFRDYALSSLSISADGRIVAAVKGMSHFAAYAMRVGASQEPRETIIPLTFHDRSDYPGSWDASSQSVYITSDRYGRWAIFRQDLARHDPEYVVGGSTFSARYPVLSPDGLWLLYQANNSSQPIVNWSTPIKLLRVPVAGGPPQEVWDGQGYYRVDCTWLPANRCVLATRDADKASVLFSDFDPITGKRKDLGRIATPVVTPGTLYYSWALSPDGSQVALCEPHETGTLIRVISFSGARERQMKVAGWQDLESIRWTSDGTGFFLLMTSDDGSSLLWIDGHGRAHTLLEKDHALVSMAPSPDGKWLAFSQLDSSTNVFLFSGL